MTGEFSPYMLFRRGTIGLAALDGLVPKRFWALLDEVDVASRRRTPLQDKLANALYALVPQASADERRELLAARRAVHNDQAARLPSRPDLPEPVRHLLDEWSQEREAADALAAQVEEALSAELAAGRRALAAVAQGEDFQRGVQLSGEDVYRDVMAYAVDPFDPGRKPSRTRRAESTITSFAYRVALKPSPFGAFTEIGAGPWEPGTAPAVRHTRVRLSVGLLMWMVHQLHRIDGADDLLRVRLNNSLAIREGRAVFVRRPIEGADDGFEPDRVVVARYTDLVRVLMTALGDGELTVRQLREQLVAAGVAPTAVTDTIEKLVKVGLCHRGLGLPDQTTDLAGQAAVVLRRVGSAQAVSCAEIFEGLRAIERSYGVASARRRTGLLAELRELVHRFADVCGAPPPAREAMRAAMYEDVGTSAPPRSWRSDLLAANRENFDLLQRLVPVLDDATIEKLGLYRFFTQRFGATAEVPFVEVYRQFAELPPTAASAVMCGVDDPATEAVRALRSDFFDLLRARLAADPAAEQLALNPTELSAFTDRLPESVQPWRSAAYRVQFDQVRGTAVINGMTTGHGVFFSRFCDLLEPEDGDGWSLAAALRRHIARTGPRQTDITMVLGLNFNLHPQLSPLELVYPGSVAGLGAQAAMALSDLTVRADPRRHRLVLVSGRDGQPIDLVPLNFLYPAAAPMLYRFLCVFAPTRTYRGGVWDQLDRADGLRTGPRPRLVLGDLVLDRRSWRVGVDELPALAELERYEAAGLAAFDSWRQSVGLPRKLFFRMVAPPVLPVGERDLLAETRQWALEARSARLHKPHYLDVHNPFLTYVFAKQARAMTGGSVLIHECLPVPADQDEFTGAEEFFVEFNRGTADVR